MKKILSIFMIFVMLFTLSACSGGDGNDEGEKAPSQDNSGTFAEFSLGKNVGNEYHSDFVGLSIKVPDGWNVSSDEDILEINNINKEIYDEDPEAAVKGMGFLYDMYAVNEADGSTVCVILEKIDASEKLKLNIRSVIESQFESLKNSCEELGYTDIELSYKKITVDGRELDGYELSTNYFGLVFRTVGLSFVRGDYLVSITVAALGEDGVEDIIGGFDFE